MAKPQRLTVSQARNQLGLVNQTGLGQDLDRLLYLGSGTDLVASVALFWNACNDFYLVDPIFTQQAGIERVKTEIESPKTEEIKDLLAEAKVDVKLERLGIPFGGIPTTVVRVRANNTTKRIILVGCRTSQWLKESAPFLTVYTVAIQKDYDAIDTPSPSDKSEFPYPEIWGKLVVNGWYAETIGENRSSKGAEFALYRSLGFTPIYEVVRNNGNNLGFAQGLYVFQKSKKAEAIKYLDWEKSQDRIKKTLYEIFATAADNDPLMESTNPRDKEMWGIVKNITPLDWSTIITVKEFRNWIWQQIKKKTMQNCKYFWRQQTRKPIKKCSKTCSLLTC